MDMKKAHAELASKGKLTIDSKQHWELTLAYVAAGKSLAEAMKTAAIELGRFYGGGSSTHHKWTMTVGEVGSMEEVVDGLTQPVNHMLQVELASAGNVMTVLATKRRL